MDAANPQNPIAVPKPAEPYDKAVALVTAGADPRTTARALTELGMTNDAANALIETIRAEMAAASQTQQSEERGKAILRLNNIYLRSLQVQDYKTCLAAQKELNRLLSLQRVAVDETGEMVSRADVNQLWETILAALRAGLRAWINTSAPAYARAKAPARLAARMQRDCTEAFDAVIATFKGGSRDNTTAAG